MNTINNNENIFGENLRKLRNEKGLTLQEISDGVNQMFGTNYSKSMFSKWENGQNIFLQTAKNICDFLGVSILEMTGLEELAREDNESYRIPILGTVSAGKALFAEENIIGYEPKPAKYNVNRFNIKNLFYLKIKGDSMNMICPDGSLVLVDKSSNVQHGDIVVLLIGDDDDATIKKISIDYNMITLIPISTNKTHKPVTYDMNKTNVELIGKVVSVIVNF